MYTFLYKNVNIHMLKDKFIKKHTFGTFATLNITMVIAPKHIRISAEMRLSIHMLAEQNTLSTKSANTYENILLGFFKIFKTDKTLNPINYIVSNFDIHDETIPDYIPFLINFNHSEYLLNILIWDYEQLC